ncbi:MAG: hypothetical protein H3C48_11100 [Chitinophagaceae bacterium]|nr:hypothetical protein [Chitinophagaceae bacterium]
MNRRKFIQQGGAISFGILTGNSLSANQPGDSYRPEAFELQLKSEEDIYTFVSANNGAGPMWDQGMTNIIRAGNQVFASGLETVPEVKGLSNCKWLLFKRFDSGWKLEAKDLINLTREPCPLATFGEDKILLSVNPKQADSCIEYCLTHPEILQFDGNNLPQPYERLIPAWKINPGFNDHSYRAFAVDGENQELILFQNYMYHHAEWSFRNKQGVWQSSDEIYWPTDTYNGKEVPLRLCYSNVAIRNKQVYFFSTGDIVEPIDAWRNYKKELTGATWDYVFRRLYFSWTDDITQKRFHSWIEIANRDKTAGHIRNQDLWLDKEGNVHLLWIEYAIDERLRERFFPKEKQERSLNYAVIKKGKIVTRNALLTCREGDADQVYVAGNARFQALPDGRLFVIYYQTGKQADGKAISENAVMEILPGGKRGTIQQIPLKKAFTLFHTANERAGCSPSHRIDILGTQEGKENTISYAQVDIN